MIFQIKDTSTASENTSQAAFKWKVFLDEDTSAIHGAGQLYAECDSPLPMNHSDFLFYPGARGRKLPFFHIADTVIQMDAYRPMNIRPFIR